MRDLRGKARQHDAGRIFISAIGLLYTAADLTDFVRKKRAAS
jgi:hypothetical protein